MTPRAQLNLFLGIVAAAELALAFAGTRVDMHAGAGALVMLGIMWAPGMVGMGIQLAANRSLRGLGWLPGKPLYLAIGYLAPLVYGGLPFLLAAAIGHGTLDPHRWAIGAGHWGLPPTIVNGLLLLGTVVILPGLVMGLGEEIGWRGFMVPRLAERHGFWGVVNRSAAIWLAFHLPGMFLLGYNGPGTPLWWSLLCFAALIYGGSILFTWLRLRSGSFWPAAIAHATHNSFIQIMFGLAMHPDGSTAWLVGEFGALTPVCLGILVALLLHWGGIPTTPGAGRRASAGVRPSLFPLQEQAAAQRL